MITVGCHLTAADGYEHMAKEAISIGANTFAFFTRNPRGGKSKAVDEKDIAAFNEIWFGQQMPVGKLVAHAPYTLNPCSDKGYVREFARTAMREDLEKMEHTPGNYYNFHPGSHVGQGMDAGIDMIVEILNEVIWPQQQTIVLLETMAGKGSEIGGRFEELAEIIFRVKIKDKIGVCLDSCHISDGGYNISGKDFDSEDTAAIPFEEAKATAETALAEVLEEFDSVVGLDKLHALHLNDSKNPAGAHKDRHEKIGDGYLGVETFSAIVNHPYLKTLPMILETPNELDGYAREIELLRGLEECE